ncbi:MULTISPECIES: EAL domain-containing protein [Pseudoalteromonas]|uniref:EAL domain-containing protein n=1 Tax=Pseudoalteromonas TaxID=53246 RepID=UPI00055AF032|nr:MULTISPECIES: EAL domain-containing protein [Pseudoalteromonas]
MFKAHGVTVVQVSTFARTVLINFLLVLLSIAASSCVNAASDPTVTGWIVPANASFTTVKPLLQNAIATQTKSDLAHVRIKAKQDYWFIIDLSKQVQSKLAVIYADNAHLSHVEFYTLDDNFDQLAAVNNDTHRLINKVLPHSVFNTDSAHWGVIFARHNDDGWINIGFASDQQFIAVVNSRLRDFIIITGLLLLCIIISSIVYILSQQAKSIYLLVYLGCVLIEFLIAQGAFNYFSGALLPIWYAKLQLSLQVISLAVVVGCFIHYLQSRNIIKPRQYKLLAYVSLLCVTAILSCFMKQSVHFIVVTLSLGCMLVLLSYLFFYWRTHTKQAASYEFLIVASAVILQTLCWQASLVAGSPLYPFNELLIVINALLFVVMLLNHERKRVKQYTFSLSHDDETKLPNKRLLIKRLDGLVKLATAHSILLFRPAVLLNARANFGYEHVNEHIKVTMGKLAQQLASMNVLCVETNKQGLDCIVRLDDSTYAVVIIGKLELSQIEQLVCVINSVFADGITHKRLHLIDKVDIGVANYPLHASTSSQLIQRGLQALAAKPLHGERWHMFNIENVTLSQRRIAIASALKEAIECDQLSLFFQPQVDLNTGKIHGGEALLRWAHPQLGHVPPDLFIPIAESAGMISDLTEWVITQALLYQKQITALLPEHIVSINISAKDLLRKDLPVLFITLLDEFKLNANNIMLELTESATLFEGVDIKNALNDYRLIGVKIAIDDFGTGYSSLAYLSKMGFDEIKIDKQFVMNIEYSKNDQTICRATCDIAKSLGSYVVAEGIEDSQSMVKLQSYGCEIGQGYYFSRPLAFDAYMLWLEQHLETTPLVTSDGQTVTDLIEKNNY